MGKAGSQSEENGAQSREYVAVGAGKIVLAQKDLRLVQKKYHSGNDKQELSHVKRFIDKVGQIAVFNDHSEGAPERGNQGEKGEKAASFAGVSNGIIQEEGTACRGKQKVDLIVGIGKILVYHVGKGVADQGKAGEQRGKGGEGSVPDRTFFGEALQKILGKILLLCVQVLLLHQKRIVLLSRGSRGGGGCASHGASAFAQGKHQTQEENDKADQIVNEASGTVSAEKAAGDLQLLPIGINAQAEAQQGKDPDG